MSDYIFLLNVGDSIINEVTITKLIQNRRSSASKFCDFKIGLYTQKFESTIWEKLGEVSFKDNSVLLKSSDYDLSVGQLVVILPCHANYHLKNNLNELPEPLVGKLNSSLINVRANIAFIKDNSRSSFQGDFPYNMSRIKGTFLAFDHLVCSNHEAVKTKFILVNVHSKKLQDKISFNLYMANSKSKKSLINSHYVHNSVAIIDNVNKHDCSSLFYSKDTLGIPIFISFTENMEQFISVEHAHPPSEYFWGDDKFRGQSIIKSTWLDLLT
jgi:hypothetical protein